MKKVDFSNVKLEKGFWKGYQDTIREVTVPAIYDRFAETGRFAALRCEKDGLSHLFWDSDVAKWIESVAFLTQTKREPAFEAIADEAIEQIVKHQLENGYFNSHYIAKMPDKIFAIRVNHELYCAGHLIEAAIAYHLATGKDALLKAMCRYADHIYKVFYLEKSAAFVTPGHEEIELALLKLAEHTGEEKYRTLAAYFINERGKHPDEAQKGIEDKQIGEGRGTVREYFNWLSQSDLPVRECGTAHGHAVRAGYLYTAMAALARQTNDEELRGACARLFRDIVDTKLSITGGVGAQVYGEAFGPAYRLPNRENYNETCAAIALVMFASELQKESARKEYADVIERVLYNGMISGLSLDGDAFFYENALEIDLRDYDYSTRIFRSNISAGEAHNYGLLHERRLKRAKVFSCSCCPPNITRMLATVAGHMYSVDGDVIYCHQFASSEATLNVKGEEARLTLRTDYPNDGKLTYTYFGPKAVLAVRIPDWCVEYAGETQDGYATFSVADGDTVTVTLPMEIHFVEANRMVSETAGKYAVSRGPIVYCMEGRENGGQLWDVVLCEQGEKKVSPSARYGAPTLSIAAYHRPTREALYSLKSNERVAFTAKLIPYFAFANGEEADDMQIWTRVE